MKFCSKSGYSFVSPLTLFHLHYTLMPENSVHQQLCNTTLAGNRLNTYRKPAVFFTSMYCFLSPGCTQLPFYNISFHDIMGHTTVNCEQYGQDTAKEKIQRVNKNDRDLLYWVPKRAMKMIRGWTTCPMKTG